MLRKIIKIILLLVVALIVLLLLAYGISKSDFTKIKKYDENDPNAGLKLKAKIAKERFYTNRVTITEKSIANLGDFTLNVPKNRTLTTNISIKFKDKDSDNWLSPKKAAHEITDKGDVLRSVVIDTISNHRNADVSNEKIKATLVNGMNNYLNDVEVEEIYFNKYIVQ